MKIMRNKRGIQKLFRLEGKNEGGERDGEKKNVKSYSAIIKQKWQKNRMNFCNFLQQPLSKNFRRFCDEISVNSTER